VGLCVNKKYAPDVTHTIFQTVSLGNSLNKLAMPSGFLRIILTGSSVNRTGELLLQARTSVI